MILHINLLTPRVPLKTCRFANQLYFFIKQAPLASGFLGFELYHNELHDNTRELNLCEAEARVTVHLDGQGACFGAGFNSHSRLHQLFTRLGFHLGYCLVFTQVIMGSVLPQ